MEKHKLKGFDRQIGAILGFAKGLLIAVVVTLFALMLLPDNQKQTVVNSYSGHAIAVLLDKATPIMPEEVHQVLSKYLQEPLDELEQLRTGNAELVRDQGDPRSSDPLDELERRFRDEAVDQVRDRVDRVLRPTNDPRYGMPENGYDNYRR